MSDIVGPLVFVIESPSPADLYHRRSEGELITQAVSLNGIPNDHVVAVTREAFMAAITIGLAEAMGKHPNRAPIVHISAHGSQDGIQLCSKETFDWEELRYMLTPVNHSLNCNLLLCMSSCEGLSGFQMAMHIDECPHPYFAIVGSWKQPSWSETAVAYHAFYHHIAIGNSLINAVEAMKAASGHDAWALETAEETKKSFLQGFCPEDLLKARTNLQKPSLLEGLLTPTQP